MLNQLVDGHNELTVPLEHVIVEATQHESPLVARICLCESSAYGDARVDHFLDQVELLGNCTRCWPLTTALLSRRVLNELSKGVGINQIKDVLQSLFSTVSHALDKIFPDNLRRLINQKDVQVSQELDLISNLFDFRIGSGAADRLQEVCHRN